MAFSSGDARYPRVEKDKLKYGSVACTHLNITARMWKQEMTTSGGIVCKPESGALQELVRLGHRWTVLSSSCPDDLLSEASVWMNSGNNSSQVFEWRFRQIVQNCCEICLVANAGGLAWWPMLSTPPVGSNLTECFSFAFPVVLKTSACYAS